MRLHYQRIFMLIVFLASLSVASMAAAQGKFKLAEGARGNMCLECHETFSDVMKKKHIHSPLAEGNCTGCHSPHTTDHGRLMAADANSICQRCHEDIVPQDAASTHQVVLEGNCTLCHDPHASNNRNNLVEAGSALCFGCHVELGEDIADNRYPHAPVQQDCLTCHNPHASQENENLLTASAPALCVECHDTSKGTFKDLHMGYPVETADCSSCHNPHGSGQKSILHDVVHEPVSNRMCKQCHNAPDSAEPLALLRDSYELCQGCHYDMVNETFNQERIHWPLVDGTGCINCHSPHASSVTGLLEKPMLDLCGTCHADTVSRQERSQTPHPPIAEGECATCHSVHSSNNMFLLNNASSFELCGECHEWQTHSTHPIGEGIVDPRNRNMELDCMSCHRTHGTEYKHFIYYETINDLCVQCHTKYRR